MMAFQRWGRDRSHHTDTNDASLYFAASIPCMPSRRRPSFPARRRRIRSRITIWSPCRHCFGSASIVARENCVRVPGPTKRCVWWDFKLDVCLSLPSFFGSFGRKKNRKTDFFCRVRALTVRRRITQAACTVHAKSGPCQIRLPTVLRSTVTPEKGFFPPSPSLADEHRSTITCGGGADERTWCYFCQFIRKKYFCYFVT